jgi:hypothetical protein
MPDMCLAVDVKKKKNLISYLLDWRYSSSGRALCCEPEDLRLKPQCYPKKKKKTKLAVDV